MNYYYSKVTVTAKVYNVKMYSLIYAVSKMIQKRTKWDTLGLTMTVVGKHLRHA